MQATAALYLKSMNASVSGKTNSSNPVALFNTECTDTNFFCRIYPAVILLNFMIAMTATPLRSVQSPDRKSTLPDWARCRKNALDFSCVYLTRADHRERPKVISFCFYSIGTNTQLVWVLQYASALLPAVPYTYTISQPSNTSVPSTQFAGMRICVRFGQLRKA